MNYDSIDDLISKIKSAVPSALLDDRLHTYLKESMKTRILSNVYSEYKPDTYRRRFENGGLGAEENIQITVLGDYIEIEDVAVGSSQPSAGPFEGKRIDDLIESGQGYTWAKRPGPRPFYEPFESALDVSYIATLVEECINDFI